MNEKLFDVFCELLRTSLSNGIPSGFINENLSDADWQTIYGIACEQGVAGIVFPSIEKLQPCCRPPKEVLLNWYAATTCIQKNNLKTKFLIATVTRWFAAAGIKTVVLKGLACAAYYPKPELRLLGDFDCYLCGDYEKGNMMARMNGAFVENHDYKHSHIFYKGLMVENHRFFTKIRGRKINKSFERRLVGIVQDFVCNKDSSETPIVPPAQFNALFFAVHAYTHFMDERLTIRQVCDWALFLKKEHDNIDWQDFYQWMERLGMTRFVGVLNNISRRFVDIDCDIVQTKDKILEDKVLCDMLAKGHSERNNKNIGIVKYRLCQLCATLNADWKYRTFSGESAAKHYLRGLWYYLSERNPSL